jgi:hypothetical protein
VFTAPVPPVELQGFEDRLRSRLESGLVVDLLPSTDDPTLAEQLEEAIQSARAGPSGPTYDEAFLNREKLLWDWPYLQDSVVQELE